MKNSANSSFNSQEAFITFNNTTVIAFLRLPCFKMALLIYQNMLIRIRKCSLYQSNEGSSCMRFPYPSPAVVLAIPCSEINHRLAPPSETATRG